MFPVRATVLLVCALPLVALHATAFGAPSFEGGGSGSGYVLLDAPGPYLDAMIRGHSPGHSLRGALLAFYDAEGGMVYSYTSTTAWYVNGRVSAHSEPAGLRIEEGEPNGVPGDTGVGWSGAIPHGARYLLLVSAGAQDSWSYTASGPGVGVSRAASAALFASPESFEGPLTLVAEAQHAQAGVALAGSVPFEATLGFTGILAHGIAGKATLLTTGPDGALRPCMPVPPLLQACAPAGTDEPGTYRFTVTGAGASSYFPNAEFWLIGADVVIPPA